MAATVKPIRIGVLGVRRGCTFARNAEVAGMELVAICDQREDKLREAGSLFNVDTYTDFDTFLEHDMDAVVLANYFHQHAPFAIKALSAGKHVMSETSACKTLAEGVALARAVENSGKIYMLSENYCYFVYNQEMRRLYQAGEIGEVAYAEGEYQHPMSARICDELAPGLDHWRNRMPSTYYCTHAMGPIMYITDTRPVSVNAQSITQSENDKERHHVKTSDYGFVIISRMDNGAMSRIIGMSMRGESIWYRFHGTRGMMENLRTPNPQMVRITHDEWDRREGDVKEKIYLPDFPSHGDVAPNTGHYGGDFFTNYHFAEAIRKNEQPYLDVYRGIDMTLVGIQAWRSCLSNGSPVEIPDFRDETVRKNYENDDWSPYPEDRKPGQPWPSIKGEIKPSQEAIDFAQSIWNKG